MSIDIQELLREESGLTNLAFSRLLEWLDAGVPSNGQRYLDMRRRLVSYFVRRNRPFADDLADETFARLARTLGTTGRILVTPPARYCYVVARFVLLEDLRRSRRYVSVEDAPLVAMAAPAANAGFSDPANGDDHRARCLEWCLEGLKPEQREIVVEYYRGERRARIDRRRALACRLGISPNALGLRASRIRSALERCIADRSKHKP